MKFEQSPDAAAVEHHLQFHERTSRVSRVILVVLLAGTLAQRLDIVPAALSVLLRPTMVGAITSLAGLEAWRVLGGGQLPGRLRWTRMAIGADAAAMALAVAVGQLWPDARTAPDRVLAVGVALLSLALVFDLREYPRRHPSSLLARVGMGLGAIGAALMATALLGESSLSMPAWSGLFFAAAALMGSAGAIYLRLRSVDVQQHDSGSTFGSKQ